MKLTPFAKLFITVVILGVIAYVVWTYRGVAIKKLWTESTGAPTAEPAGPGAPSDTHVVLRLSGSNAIGASLAPALAEAFLQKKGARSVERLAGASPDETSVVGVLPGESVRSAIQVSAHGSS